MEEEVTMFEACGFHTCSLGTPVLRTDTAAIAAVGIANEAASRLAHRRISIKKPFRDRNDTYSIIR
jgi:hypothetical protein